MKPEVDQKDHNPSDLAARSVIGPTSTHGNERINAFCDGVFAIVITLLVLEIKVPDLSGEMVGSMLPGALLGMVPKILGHIVSFAVLGIYWVGHHNQMLHVRRHDRTYLWLTVLFLLCVASMPFPTGLLIRYPTQQIAVIVYAGSLIAAGISLDLLWWYATRNHHLVSHTMEPDFIRFVHRRILTAPLFYLVAIVVSFFNVFIAILIFALTAAYYIIPNPFDQYHHRNLHRANQDRVEASGN
jgi:uncharacterized membrane protein